MNARLTWRNRDAMLIRGRWVFTSHVRNHREGYQLHDWFVSNLHRYASWTIGNVKQTDMAAVERKFWRDAEILHILAMGFDPADYGAKYSGQFDHLSHYNIVKAAR